MINQQIKTAFLQSTLALSTLISPISFSAQAAPRGEADASLVSEISLQDVPDKTTEATSEVYALAASDGVLKVKASDGQSYDLRGVDLVSLGGDNYAMFSVANTDACGACTGINVVHSVIAAEGGWVLNSEHRGVGATGSMGNPALQWAVTKRLGKNPFLVTQAGGVWQGYSCEVISLTELTPTGPIERGTFPVSYYNSGADEDTKKSTNLEGALVAGKADKSFSIRFSGSSRFTQNYQMKKGEYRLVGKSKLPSC